MYMRRRSAGIRKTLCSAFLLLYMCVLTPLPFTLCCGAAPLPDSSGEKWICNVVLEDNPALNVKEQVLPVPEGEDAVFSFELSEDYEITGVSRDEYELERSEDGRGWLLTLHEIRYPETVTVYTEKLRYHLRYEANGGKIYDAASLAEAGYVFTDGPAEEHSSGSSITVGVGSSHLRCNTGQGTRIFARDGYTLESWNTQPDGSGQRVGLGSRITVPEGETLCLYAIWKPWEEEDSFLTEEIPDGIRITGLTKEAKERLCAEDELVIPEQIGGKPVTQIGENARKDLPCSCAVLPPSLKKVSLGAFAGSALREITMFDSLREITDYSFGDSTALKTLHINAAVAPVYSGTYYDTFTDKMDRLMSVKDRKKIILFSGSSTRFGFDSEALHEAFPEYEIVNMGVFAYTNALPQLELIRPLMKEGDILIHSPEFDASKRQFCTTDRIDAAFFNMIEGNYDLAAQLDLQSVSGIFSAFSTFVKTRDGMEERTYARCAADFDEDGNPVREKTYNVNGDYILYRPDAPVDAPVYGLPVDYTVEAFPMQYLESINRMYRSFTRKGIKVFFTYAPRNAQAVSEQSTPEALEQLDAYFRKNLEVPVLEKPEDCLYPGHLLYGTDNHLSTNGVRIRTQRLIKALKEAGACQ